MRGITSILAIAFGLSVAGGVASAEPWDSKGWVKLGEREVNGKYDHDKIEVGRYEGTFTKLTLYVEKGVMTVDEARALLDLPPMPAEEAIA